MSFSARTRLELAMRKARCYDPKFKDLITEASKSPDIDIKIECFKQWAEETDEFRKQAERELGADFKPTWNWRSMPEEKAIEILKI